MQSLFIFRKKTARLLALFMALALGIACVPAGRAAAAQALLAVPNVVGEAGETVQVPVNLTSSGDVAGIEFDLSYDQTLLGNPSAVKGDLTSGFSNFVINKKTAGKIGVMIFSNPTATVAAGTGSVAVISFDVAAGAKAGSGCTLALSNVVLSDGKGKTMPASKADGAFSVATLPPVQLTVTPASFSLTAGNTKQLATTMTPADAAVSYASDNTAVAAVSASGLVTAAAAGSAHITVTAARDGYTPAGVVVPVTVTSSGGSSSGGGGGGVAVPTVATAAATGITASSATLNGSVTSAGGEAISEYGFQYSVNGNTWTKVVAGTDDMTGAFSSPVAGLEAGATYSFKAYAVNSVGTGSGDTLSFTASPQPQSQTQNTQGQVQAASPPSFPDVPDGYWAHDAISNLAGAGILSGYPDGGFRPDEQITRAQFTCIIAGALLLSPVKTAQPAFRDVAADAWYGGYIEVANRAGLIRGYGDGLFMPEAAISRQEVAAILVQVARGGAGAQAGATMKTVFTDDAGIADWARDSVAAAVDLGLINGYPDGSFGPRRSTTRAETCAMVGNLLKKTQAK